MSISLFSSSFFARFRFLLVTLSMSIGDQVLTSLPLFFIFMFYYTYCSVVQDALYLKDFADALQRLGNNAGVSDSDKSALIHFSDGANKAELGLHQSFFQTYVSFAELM